MAAFPFLDVIFLGLFAFIFWPLCLTYALYSVFKNLKAAAISALILSLLAFSTYFYLSPEYASGVLILSSAFSVGSALLAAMLKSTPH